MDITWNKILGHQEAIRELRRGLQKGKLPHGILLEGTKGVGKSKVAAALAAAILCGKGDEACGSCPSCQAFLRENHPDFLLVKPEAKGKATPIIRIEQIREMQNTIATFPIMENGRAVIIDDAQTMNPAAANCLLKTLEEPTGNVTFILIADSRSNLLETIVSRCMPLSFGALPADQVEKFLRERGIPEEQAEILTALSGGSIGDAVACTGEEALALQGDVLGFIKSLRRFTAKELWRRSLTFGDKKDRILKWLACLYAMLRDMLALKLGVDAKLTFHRNLTVELEMLNGGFTEAQLFAWLALTAESHRRLTANVNLRLAMESFLIRMGEAG